MRAKKILKKINLNGKWTKVNLFKYNDFYLSAIKAEKVGKKDTLDMNCVQRIRFEVAVESGKKGCPFTIGYLTLNFNEISSSNVELNKITALTKVMGYPSTFYIRPIDMTGERSVVTEGVTSVAVYVSELRLK
jgi:hypothetical protein